MPPKRPVLDRLFDMIEVGSPGDCWPHRHPNTAGYGRIKADDGHGYQDRKAHRVMYQEVFGVCVLPWVYVCHQCDTPACCNPMHLYLDTHAGNMADMVGRGRGGAPRGEAHPNAKLTRAAVEAIRASTESVSALSRRYGVHRVTINKAKRGVNWGH